MPHVDKQGDGVATYHTSYTQVGGAGTFARQIRTGGSGGQHAARNQEQDKTGGNRLPT
eukprot:COSAG01_NODE_14036_length_1504_cov_1.845552_2_plen_58_part_00